MTPTLTPAEARLLARLEALVDRALVRDAQAVAR